MAAWDADRTLLHERYLLEKEIARGGMGAVYRAYDNRLKKSFAVKQFCLSSLPTEQETRVHGDDRIAPMPGVRSTPPPTREQAIAQFQREAQILANLKHPNLPNVIDVFADGDDWYLVMDLIDGDNLETVMKNAESGRVPEAEVLQWMDQVMDALEYCHQEGIVHRDVKPANVIVDRQGRVYLVDFGIVKDKTQSQTLLQAATPGFSSPEQHSTRTPTDTRSDIYSLGATIYALLTGQAPPSPADRQLEPMACPREIVEQISALVDRAIVKAMAIKPEDRHQSIAEMRAALAEKAAGSTDGLKVWTRTLARPAPLIAAVLVIGTVVLGVLALAGNKPTSTPGPAPDPTDTPTPITTSVATIITTTADFSHTVTETPTAARPTDTAIPSPTPTRTSTHTPPPTATPQPTDTPTPKPTDTPLPTLTPTPSPTVRWLPGPLLVAPLDGAEFRGWNAEVDLSWQPVPGIKPDEYYVLSVPWGEAENEVAQFWRQETTVRLPPHFSSAETGFADRHYSWTVQVMRCTQNCVQIADDNVKKQGFAVGNPSETGLFFWHQDIGGETPAIPPP